MVYVTFLTSFTTVSILNIKIEGSVANMVSFGQFASVVFAYTFSLVYVYAET